MNCIVPIFLRTFGFILEMDFDYNISAPFQFNPLKHHLLFIKEILSLKLEEGINLNVKNLVRELRHIGTSVMDIYTGDLSVDEIFEEVRLFLTSNGLSNAGLYAKWSGTGHNDFKTITLSDGSQWTLKYHYNKLSYVHLFPARYSPHSFRVKANTLKSAVLYYILIGKDFITGDDLNKARRFLGLSPVKDSADAEAITEMIEILRTGYC